MSPHRRQEQGNGVLALPVAPGRYGEGIALVNIGAALRRLLAVVLVLAGCGLTAAAEAAPRILVLGDSLTAGFGLNPSQAFPVRLQASLAAQGIDAQVVNGGVSGDTTADGLARLDWALADHPDIVLLELGANDALRGIDPKLTYANLDKIMARLTATGAKVILMGMMAPSNWGRDYEKAFDAIYPELAQKYQVPLYPFFLDGVAMDPSLNQPDGLHPNAHGVDIIADKVAPYVARLIADARAQG